MAFINSSEKTMQRLLTPIIICLLLLSCSSGKKAFERGDYYNATLQAVNRLRSNPNSDKALQAVKDSYPMALTYFQGKIDYTLTTNNPFKYSEVADYYEKMNQLSDEISRCPAALNLFPKVTYYTNQLDQIRKLAAEEQYSAGLENEKINTRLSWKDAYLNFQQTDRFAPGYKDVKRRLDDAKYNATLKVVVEKIPVPRAYQLTSDFFLQQIIENLMRYRPNEFVAYYSPESADKAGIKNPDQLLKMSFDDFVIGQAYDKEIVRQVSRDSVEVGTVTLSDGKKMKAYNTVRAKLRINHRELISNGILDVTIVDLAKNTVVSQRKFPGQFIWSIEWGSFNGDERALNDKEYAICKRKPSPPPGPQDLFIEFTKPIFKQVTPFLKSFYQQF
jgi:hypothetical protein